MTLVDWEQAEVLADRYFSALLGRLGSLALFLFQGPAIAAILVVVWGDAKADQRVELFLCIAALWVGCLNACREVCSEWALYRRERRVFLEIPAYLLSKVVVLSGINAVQAIALLWILNYHVGLPGSKLLLLLTLMLAASAGTMIGLVISSLVSSPDKALALVPLAILPQLLLTPAFRPDDGASATVGVLQDWMPLNWAFDLYRHVVLLPSDPDWGGLLEAAVVCTLMVVALYGLACLALWWQDE